MKTKILTKMVNELVNQRDMRFPGRKEVRDALRPAALSNRISKPIAGGEEIPVGGWRGGEDIPAGGWRGGEEIPEGGWRASSKSSSSNRNGSNILTKTINRLFKRKGPHLPTGKQVYEELRSEATPNKASKPITGGEDLPSGGWKGGEEIPTGGWRGGEEIPEGGWRASSDSFLSHLLGINTSQKPTIKDVYRTKDGRHYFEFVFVWTGGYYDIDILKMPSYGNRSDDLHPTHRLPSDRGGYKICFGDPYLIDSLDTGRKWAGIWAECTMNYILYGNNFPNE